LIDSLFADQQMLVANSSESHLFVKTRAVGGHQIHPFHLTHPLRSQQGFYNTPSGRKTAAGNN